MLLASNNPKCPWTIILSDDKKKARINTIRYILQNVEYPEKIKKRHLTTDDNVVRSGEEEIEIMEKSLPSENLSHLNG